MYMYTHLYIYICICIQKSLYIVRTILTTKILERMLVHRNFVSSKLSVVVFIVTAAKSEIIDSFPTYCFPQFVRVSWQNRHVSLSVSVSLSLSVSISLSPSFSIYLYLSVSSISLFLEI